MSLLSDQLDVPSRVPHYIEPPRPDRRGRRNWGPCANDFTNALHDCGASVEDILVALLGEVAAMIEVQCDGVPWATLADIVGDFSERCADTIQPPLPQRRGSAH